MEKILKQYDYNPKSEEINATLAEIESNLESWRRNEVLYSCIGFTDLTTLKTEDTPSKVASLTEKVNNFKREFPDAPYPASICVYPNFASVIRDNLKVKGVDITTVAGCFPCSQSFLEVKELECRLAAENGANEIDITEFVQSINSARDIKKSYIETVYNYNVSVLELELYTDK